MVTCKKLGTVRTISFGKATLELVRYLIVGTRNIRFGVERKDSKRPLTSCLCESPSEVEKLIDAYCKISAAH